MGEAHAILPRLELVLSEWFWIKEDGSPMKEKDRKESIERIKNNIEQAKTNLKSASESGDDEEIKYWSKQVKILTVILQRCQGIALKKS